MLQKWLYKLAARLTQTQPMQTYVHESAQSSLHEEVEAGRAFLPSSGADVPESLRAFFREQVREQMETQLRAEIARTVSAEVKQQMESQGLASVGGLLMIPLGFPGLPIQGLCWLCLSRASSGAGKMPN